MSVPEVKPTRSEIRAVQQGRREFARGEFLDWKDLKKSQSQTKEAR